MLSFYFGKVIAVMNKIIKFKGSRLTSTAFYYAIIVLSNIVIIENKNILYVTCQSMYT